MWSETMTNLRPQTTNHTALNGKWFLWENNGWNLRSHLGIIRNPIKPNCILINSPDDATEWNNLLWTILISCYPLGQKAAQVFQLNDIVLQPLEYHRHHTTELSVVVTRVNEIKFQMQLSEWQYATQNIAPKMAKHCRRSFLIEFIDLYALYNYI